MIAKPTRCVVIAMAACANIWLASPVSGCHNGSRGCWFHNAYITLGSGITFTGVDYTGAGSVGFTTTAITYTPPDNFTGQSDITTGEDVTYTLSNGTQATETITVTAVNDAPVAVNDTATLTEDD